MRDLILQLSKSSIYSTKPGGSAVSQFAMMARKFGKQLIVAVSEKDAIKLKDNFNIIGTLSYGKENFIAMSHTKSEFCS
nr:hypothetical protein [Klebsiella pneumoniae]